MSKIIHHIRKHLSGLKKEVLKQMLTLATSGFGLVAALAWNEFIKEIVADYIKPLVGGNSGLISLLIYAVFSSKTQKLLDDIHELSVSTLNLILQNRDKFSAKV